MEVTTKVENSRALIGLAGKMTVQTSLYFAEMVDGLPAKVCDIDIDLVGVDYVSSAGLRALVSAARLTAARGGRMRLLSPQASVRDMFDLAGLANMLDIEG